MIIIELMGGLGNQMQQYALYRKFLSLGKEAKLDASWFDGNDRRDRKYPREFELAYFQSLPMALCTKREKEALTGGDGAISRLLRKTGLKKNAVREVEGMYEPDIFALDDAYLVGYFACNKYYEDVLPAIRRDVVFPVNPDGTAAEKNRAAMEQMDRETFAAGGEAHDAAGGQQGGEELPGCRPAQGVAGAYTDDTADRQQGGEKPPVSCSIHFRRGDYLDPANSFLTGICTEAYYEGAVRYLKEQFPGRRFHYWLFSDDPDFARSRHFGDGDEENTVVDWNTGKSSLLDMQLMSRCSVNICANSTFSFWGARLNPREDAVRIRPSTHRTTQVESPELMHVYWKNWILINAMGELI